MRMHPLLLFVLACVLILLPDANAAPAGTDKGKGIVDEGAGTSDRVPKVEIPFEAGPLVLAHRPAREQQLLDPPHHNPFDQTPLSFDDVVQGRYRPTSTSSTHLSQLIAAENDPTTMLFYDDAKPSAAPIIDMTYPRTYSSFNALVHRYRMLHFYRILPSGQIDSRSLFFNPRVAKSLTLTREPDLIRLPERISQIENIRRNYGDNIAAARFHRRFSPISTEVREMYAQKQPTWADIINTGFFQTPVRGPMHEIRAHLDTYRAAKFLSFDGTRFLGIRIDADGIASHLDAPLHHFH